ncbi:hypothetical protein ACE3NQ_00520 [Paenibacillus terreus]|uniref:Uncharacterized protein n=1 Tax=Paenibacillus terreus TaxID=1387834 RepID=A0ABV5B1N8_9BACL
MADEHREFQIDRPSRSKTRTGHDGVIRLDVQDILRQCGLEEPEWLREWLVRRES